jgi:hypothetical protein
MLRSINRALAKVMFLMSLGVFCCVSYTALGLKIITDTEVFAGMPHRKNPLVPISNMSVIVNIGKDRRIGLK